MTATKLSRAMREYLATAVLKHTFDDRKAALKVREDTLSRKVLASMMTPAETKHFKALPDRFWYMDNDLNVVISGHWERIGFSGNVPQPRFAQGSAVASYEATHEFAIEYEALAGDKNALFAEERTLLASITAVIDTASSVKRLLEIWPEVKTFIPADWTQQKNALVPVELIAKINATAGLEAVAA